MHAPLTHASYHCLSLFYNGWLESGLDAFPSSTLHSEGATSGDQGNWKAVCSSQVTQLLLEVFRLQSEHDIRVGVLPLHVDQSAHMAGHVEQHLVRRTAPRHP